MRKRISVFLFLCLGFGITVLQAHPLPSVKNISASEFGPSPLEGSFANETSSSESCEHHGDEDEAEPRFGNPATEGIGYLATVVTSGLLLPALYDAYRHHERQQYTKSILVFSVGSIFENLLWGTYGVSTRDLPVLLSSASALTLSLFLTYFYVIGQKIKNQQTCQQLFDY